MVTGYFPSVSEQQQTDNESLLTGSATDGVADVGSKVVGRRAVLKLAGISSLPLAGVGVENAAASGSTSAIATVGYGMDDFGANGYGGTN